MTDKEKEKLHQILSSLWKNDDTVGKMCYNQALQDAQIAIDSLQEEPKECMYSKENYTDEDRKTLCEGCEEECRFNKKEEPVSEDLEEAIGQSFIYHENRGDDFRSDKQIETAYRQGFETGAKWKEKEMQSTIELAEDHAMFAGMEKMKEELMAKAVEVTVHIEAGNYPYIPQMELYDYDNDVPLAKEGDKYKVVLIKE